MSALSEAEIERRAPLWSALSDLFLDTDVSLHDAHVAEAMRASGYSAEEIERILREEVGPVFYDNLLDIAGEWAGWPDGWVRKQVLEHLAQPAPQRAAAIARSAPVLDKLVSQDFRRVRLLVWGDS